MVRVVFASLSPSTASSAAPATGPAGDPGTAARIQYEPDSDGSPAAFRGSPRYAQFRQEFEDTVAHIAGHAAAMDFHALQPALETLTEEVFDDPGFDGNRAQMFVELKPALERILACLEDPRLTPAQCTPVLDSLAMALPKCSGGKINGCASAALKLEMLRDGSRASHARLALHDVLQAHLQRTVAGEDPRQEMVAFETHHVQAMMNALAPVFGFDAVADPFIGPLSAVEQAEIDWLQSPAGTAAVASRMLAALADRYLDTLRDRLGPGHPLSRGERMEWQDAKKVHDCMEQDPALVSAYGGINPMAVLQPCEDEDGNVTAYAAHPDTTMLQCELTGQLQAEGVLSDLVPDVLARWSRPPMEGAQAASSLSLQRLGQLYWVKDSSQPGLPRPLELADLAHLKIGAELPASEFLALVDRVLAHLPPADRTAADIPQLEEALRRAKQPELATLMTLDNLWAHVRAAPERVQMAERVLMREIARPGRHDGLLEGVARQGLPTLAAYLQRTLRPEEDWDAAMQAGVHAPIVAAAAGGHLDTVCALVDAGAQLSPAVAQAIDVARRAGHADTADYLHTLDATVGRLFDACARADWNQFDATLVALPAGMRDLRMRDRSGKTLLQHAIEAGSVEQVKWLIASGADIRATARGDDGEDGEPLLAAIKAGDVPIARLLFEHHPFSSPHQPLDRVMAIRRATSAEPDRTAIQLIGVLIGTLTPASKDYRVLMQSVLLEAVSTGRIELARRLMLGLPDNALDPEYGPILLRRAARLGSPAAAAGMTGMLLETGWSLRPALQQRFRPGISEATVTLEEAAARGQDAVVLALLRSLPPGDVLRIWEEARQLPRPALMQAMKALPLLVELPGTR